MSTLTLDMVTSDDGLRALAPAWARLWHRVPGATPFQSPAWLLPWWVVFGTVRPVIACLREGDRLAGVLPLYLLDVAEERKLLSIGIGVSDYLDILLEPGLPEDAAALLLEAGLRAGFTAGATVCDLTDLPPGARLRTLHPPAGWRAAWRSGDPCPVLSLLDNAIPARQRRKLRMNRHRAERLGGWTVEFATPGTVGSMMDTLLRLNARRWGGLDPAAQRFHRAAAPGLLDVGLLRLAQLRIGGAVAACCHALADGDKRVMFYMIGFDPAFAAASPGSLLIGALLDAAIAEGRTEAHFLRGDEAYKYAWGARDRPNAACRLVPA